MNVIESLQWRYACKKFDCEKLLSQEQINNLKEAFNLTATSYGLQPIKLLVIQNKELQKRLVEHSYNQQQVYNASHLLVICIQDDFTLADIDAYFNLVKQVRETPESILENFRNQLKASFEHKTTEEKQKSAINQAYIALGNLMTVCAVEKIDACPMEGFNAQKYDEILDLRAKNLKSVLLLPVGFRANDDFMSKLKKVRKPINETVLNIN